MCDAGECLGSGSSPTPLWNCQAQIRDAQAALKIYATVLFFETDPTVCVRSLLGRLSGSSLAFCCLEGHPGATQHGVYRDGSVSGLFVRVLSEQFDHQNYPGFLNRVLVHGGSVLSDMVEEGT